MAPRALVFLVLAALAAFAPAIAEEPCNGQQCQSHNMKTIGLVQKSVIQAHAHIDAEEEAE
eukprot:7443750-Alexandrium_andersonii.AAC.1